MLTFLKEYEVTSVRGAQIITKPWVTYSYYILPLKNHKSKSESTWDSPDRSERHDRHVLLW